MDTETAIAHLEAYMFGEDEIGDVSKEDALAALAFLLRRIAHLESVVDMAEQMQEDEWHKLNEEVILAECDE